MKSVLRNLLPLLLCLMMDRYEGALISRNKSVRMIDNRLDWVAERAIDGVTDINNAERCGCCAGTSYKVDPWFQIDLLQDYNVTTIDVQGRPSDGYNQDYSGMEVYLTWQNDIGNSSPVYKQEAVTDRTTVTFTNPVLTRYITVVLAGEVRLLVICELEVFGDCSNGRFGQYCEKTCNCLGAPCDKTTGICPSNVCKAGYSGSQCNQACIDGKYGENCAGVCGSCRNYTVCNKTDGKCALCEPGYQLPQCQSACPAGSFGVNCSTICGRCKNGEPCHYSSGVCTNGCQTGYTGITCQTACQAGRYGDNCKLECGQCKDGTACDVTNGECTAGCKVGLRGPFCDLDCLSGTYGESCKRNCGKCRNRKPCNRFTGTCQGCDPGYLSVFCNRTCLYGKYGYSCLQECGHCANGSTCNVETGVCTFGCAPGFLGTFCKQECELGFYGTNCLLLCGNCKDNVTCNVTSGNCENGCSSDFTGSMCIQAYQKQSQTTLSTELLLAIGAVSVFVVVVITVTVIVVFIIKARKTRQYGNTQAHNANGSVPTTTELDDVVPQPLPPPAPEVNDVVDVVEESFKHEYDGFKTRQRGVRVHELWDYIHDRKTNGCVQFYKEFGHLKSGMVHLYDSANKKENRQKNRYRGFYAYDHSRVKLEVEDGKPDYINASFINGFGKMSKFIATQGPNGLTMNDFWLMVWQQQSAHIVMLTNLTEKGKEKCSQYWPDAGAEEYGNIYIQMISTDTSPHFTVRQLQLWMIGQTKRRVTQYHFTDWPDKDVPSTTWSLVTLWRTVMADYNANTGRAGPLVVHCSAGIGRSGTFIALDNLYQQFQIEGCITPSNIVDSLRDQRVSMVQTKEQYVYLHETIADALLIGTHDIKPNQLPEIYEFLREQDDKHPAITRLEVQHRLILSSKKNEGSEISSLATISEEPEYSNISSVNETCIADENEDATNTLKTLNLPYHSGSSGFILVNRPTQEKSDHLWSLVTDRHVKTIITLSGPAGGKSKSQTVLEVHNSKVEIVEERVTEDFMLETFRIPQTTKNQDQSPAFELTFLEFRIWNESTNVPASISSTLRCIEAVRGCQHQLSDSQPILIICRDNIPSAGLICTLLSEVDRCAGPIGMVNIIETAKLMRECNADILDKLEHYKFILDCLTEFIQQLTIYQNV